MKSCAIRYCLLCILILKFFKSIGNDFVLILNEHVGHTDPDVIMAALRNNLTGSRLNVTMHRMLSDDTYRLTEHEDWPYRTIDEYVRKLLVPSRMSVESLGTYFD